MNLTPAQQAALDALVEHGTQKEAAAALGISVRAYRDRIEQARRRNPGYTTVQLLYWHRRTVWDTAA